MKTLIRFNIIILFVVTAMHANSQGCSDAGVCTMNTGRRIRITPSLLPIYHLANDKFTDADGIEKEIANSHGLTLNGNVYFDYNLNGKSGLQISVGAPFFAREARPDGLTRSFVLNLEYRIKL